ncbi:MAG: TIGR04053 family radical SAM/SPASM domain-containing protein [Anaerolineaceae bacterium]|nr:TIGR04053 family radical SAM/SPASM domain-containing protein [Anaerolineaceae bacterium]MCB9100621.1 TIGR04053 family radical SAM/SPASM domain-containing protein [Anaerolineales bacterium]
MSHLIRQPAYDLNERPFMIIWETTNACDLSCRHCRAQAIPEHDPLGLNTADAKRLLEQVESFGTPRPIFIFTGGDPFKRADLFELLTYGSELGLMMAVSPSGTPLLNEANLQKIKACGAKAMSLSLDGSTPERHDDFRRVPGSFELTTRGWQLARQIGLKLQLNTTVTRYNLTDLPNIFRLVTEYGAMTWSLFFLVPTGRGRQEDEITPAEYEAVMHFLYDCSKYISAKTTEGHHYKRVVLQRTILDEKGLPVDDAFDLHPIYYELRQGLERVVAEKGLTPREKIRRTPLHINAGNGFVFISRRGDVYPSGFMPIKVGNIKEQSLVEIYREAPLFNTLRSPEQFEGRCGLCEFVGVCGGSRSRAYAMTGDPLAEEPFCTYQPGSWPFKEELAEKLGDKMAHE